MPPSLRRRLETGERLLGTVLTCGDPTLAEIAAARFDFAWIDLEHSALDVADVPRLALGLSAAGCFALVRLPSASFERLAAVLDTGVDGVVVPRVQSAAEAADVVARMQYPPAGTRGFAARRAAGYGRHEVHGDDGPACLVQIESRAAIAAASEIAQTRGVDALVVGTADLALDLGVQTDLNGADMAAALAVVRDAAQRAGVAFGVAAGGDAQSISRAVGDHPDLIVYSADVRIYAEAVDRVAAWIRSALIVPPTGSTDGG